MAVHVCMLARRADGYLGALLPIVEAAERRTRGFHALTGRMDHQDWKEDVSKVGGCWHAYCCPAAVGLCWFGQIPALQNETGWGSGRRAGVCLPSCHYTSAAAWPCMTLNREWLRACAPSALQLRVGMGLANHIREPGWRNGMSCVWLSDAHNSLGLRVGRGLSGRRLLVLDVQERLA